MKYPTALSQIEAELAEQQRANGAGSEREAALHGKIALLERRLGRLVWSLEAITRLASPDTVRSKVETAAALYWCGSEARMALEVYARDTAVNSGPNHRTQLDGTEIPIGRGVA